MKSFKLAITFLAAALMTYSPITWASMDIKQKARLNRSLKSALSGTYNDFYRKHALAFDTPSRALFEAWLENYGTTKMPQPQSQVLKDRNGSETLKLIFNQHGKTMTFTFNESRPQEFNINGVQIPLEESRNLELVLTKLAKHDSSLKSLVKSLSKASKTAQPKRTDLPSYRAFAQYTPLQRVGFFMHMRQVMEAAQKVKDLELKGKKTAATETSPWWMSVAWAQNIAGGDSCVVAGHISVYEKCDSGRLCCRPFPQGEYKDKHSYNQTFHSECIASEGNVACNPLLYGANPTTGKPYCLKSTDQPDFTNKATQFCGQKSQLRGEEGSPERIADYRRILESYYKLKNKSEDADQLKSCFNEQNLVNPDCGNLFQDQLSAFKNFRAEALEICRPILKREKGAGDQPLACRELLKRNLEMITYISRGPDLVRDKVTAVIVEEEKCKDVGGTWDGELFECLCNGEKQAEYKNGKYVCPLAPVETRTPTPVVHKDKCEKANGKRSNSFECNPAPWLLGLAAALGALWWLDRNDDDKAAPPPASKPPGNNGKPTLPPGPVITPTTLPPTTTMITMPPSEGGSGNNNGNSGGIRKQKGAH